MILTFWLQHLISKSMNPSTSVTKIGQNPLYWFLWYGVHNFSGRTDSRTHSQTDRPKCSMPPTPLFNGGRDIKIFTKEDWYNSGWLEESIVWRVHAMLTSISHGLSGSVGFKMLYLHVTFSRAILTRKVGQTVLVFCVRSEFVSKSVQARLQVSVCSRYNLCHPS